MYRQRREGNHKNEQRQTGKDIIHGHEMKQMKSAQGNSEKKEERRSRI